MAAVTGARDRRGANAVLRALGASRRELRRWLVRETVPIGLLAIVIGMVTGGVIAAVVLGALTGDRDGGDAVPPPQLVAPWPALAALVGVALVAIALVPLATSRLLHSVRPARRTPDRRPTMSVVEVVHGGGADPPTGRADAMVLVCIALVVGAVTGGIVAAERAVDGADDDSLEEILTNAPAEMTRLVIDVADVFIPSSSTDPLVVPRRKIEDAAASIDPLVSSVYVDPRLVIDAPRLTVRAVAGEPTASPTTVVLRVQPGLASHSSLVDGAEPRRADPIEGTPDPLEVVEVSLSTGAAAQLGWNVGSDLLVTPTTDDPLFRGFDSLPDPFVIRVASLLELSDPAEPFWFGDDRLHRAIVDDTGVGADFTVHAAVPEAQLPVVLATLGGQAALRVEERRDLDPARVDMSNVAAVERAVRATEASTTPTAAFGSSAVRLGLGDVLEAEAVRRSIAHDAVRVAAVGVIAVALAAFVQLQRAAADRRRP